jgi:hypothetical protein
MFLSLYDLLPTRKYGTLSKKVQQATCLLKEIKPPRFELLNKSILPLRFSAVKKSQIKMYYTENTGFFYYYLYQNGYCIVK